MKPKEKAKELINKYLEVNQQGIWNGTDVAIFKDLKEKLVYLQELTDMEARYNLTPIADCIEELLEVDSELTHIDFSIQLKEVISEKKVAKVNAKLF